MFDSHLHIIEKSYPLIPNQGFLPQEFRYDTYLDRMSAYQLTGGAVVSGSFQGFDQSYLVGALKKLGPKFVGVTQLPSSVTDQEIAALDDAGIRGIRVNLKRGGSEEIQHLKSMTDRVHELAGWHVELYVDSNELADLSPILVRFPAVSIDHLGLSRAGLPQLTSLAERGVRIKATGFSRGNLDIPKTLQQLHAANPCCLMFGTDLPGTRAPRVYQDEDLLLIIDTLGETAAQRVLRDNALAHYRLSNPHA